MFFQNFWTSVLLVRRRRSRPGPIRSRRRLWGARTRRCRLELTFWITGLKDDYEGHIYRCLHCRTSFCSTFSRVQCSNNILMNALRTSEHALRLDAQYGAPSSSRLGNNVPFRENREICILLTCTAHGHSPNVVCSYPGYSLLDKDIHVKQPWMLQRVDGLISLWVADDMIEQRLK